MLLLEPEITLFISPITSCSLTFSESPTHLIFIFVSPSTACFHMSSSFTMYRSPLLILHSSWEAQESGKGLNIRVNGVILHFDTPHIISPSILPLGEECGSFFLPASSPPPLTLLPYLPVIMCCRWEGIVAGQIALCLPIPSFLLLTY